jgi:hypothetical protein
MEKQKTLGELCTKVDRLVADSDRNSGRIRDLETSVDRVKTAAYLETAVVSIVAFVFWWAIGGRVTSAVRAGISATAPSALIVTPTPNSTPPPAITPKAP